VAYSCTKDAWRRNTVQLLVRPQRLNGTGRFKVMGIPYIEHPSRSGGQSQITSLAVLSLFRYTSFISIQTLGDPG
jgi:hypothetical protein